MSCVLSDFLGVVTAATVAAAASAAVVEVKAPHTIMPTTSDLKP